MRRPLRAGFFSLSSFTTVPTPFNLTCQRARSPSVVPGMSSGCMPSGFVHYRIPIDTLVHIHGLICQRYVKMNHHIHKANVAEYCSRLSAAPDFGMVSEMDSQAITPLIFLFSCTTTRYASGEDVCDISEDVNFPPCIVMRLLLDHMPLGFSKEVRFRFSQKPLHHSNHRMTACMEPHRSPTKPRMSLQDIKEAMNNPESIRVQLKVKATTYSWALISSHDINVGGTAQARPNTAEHEQRLPVRVICSRRRRLQGCN